MPDSGSARGACCILNGTSGVAEMADSIKLQRGGSDRRKKLARQEQPEKSNNLKFLGWWKRVMLKNITASKFRKTEFGKFTRRVNSVWVRIGKWV